MRRCFVLAVGVVCVASFSPALARADEGASALSSQRELDGEGAMESEPIEPSASVELSMGVSPSIGYASGLAGLAGLGNPFAPMIMPTFDVALALERRVWLVLGGGFSLMASDGETWSGASVPVLVQVYLDEPRLGTVVPTLRVGVVGSFSSAAEQLVLGLTARVSGGVTWLTSRWIALRLEIGGSVGGFVADAGGYLSGSLDAHGSLVMRL